VTGVPSVTGVRGRILPPIGLPVTGVRDRILPPIGRPAGAVRMALRRALPAAGPGTVRRDATLAVIAPRHRHAGVRETVRPPDGSGPDPATEAAPEAR